MAYETGTATNPIDLLQKLVTFLTANGWTLDSSVADGTGWRAHLHRGGDFINLKSTTGAVNPWGFTPAPAPTASSAALHLYMGTGWNGAANWNLQAGAPIGNGVAFTVGCSMPLPTGAITSYHFFADASGDNIVVVVEKTTNIFADLGWGVSLTKAGSWTGGPYFFGSLYGYSFANTSTTKQGTQNGLSAHDPFRWGDPINNGSPGYVRADVDAFTGKWLSCSNSTIVSTTGYTGKKLAVGLRGFTSAIPTDIPSEEFFRERLTPDFTNQATLIPVRIYAARDAGGYSPLGSIPAVFRSNATEEGFSSLTEVPLGADTYMIFPNFAVQKV